MGLSDLQSSYRMKESFKNLNIYILFVYLGNEVKWLGKKTPHVQRVSHDFFDCGSQGALVWASQNMDVSLSAISIMCFIEDKKVS